MKRIAWLLLAVVCSALVRMQPAELAPCCQCACCHCKVPGGCGMPCCRQGPPAPVLFAAGERASSALRAVRKAQPFRTEAVRFYAPFVESAIRPIALIASAATDPVASGPLFKAHCSFLI